MDELNRNEELSEKCDRAPESELRDRGKVSVSIVTYKTNPEDLSRLLDDLTASDHPVDVNVVDNSPSDELRSSMATRRFGYRHSDKNLGFGGGHNLALSRSLGRFKYHLVVNPDISLGRDVIGRLVDFMDHYPDVGWVMPSIRNADGTDQRLCKLLPTPADLIVRRFLGPLGSVLFRRQSDRYHLKNVDLTVPCEVPCLSGCFMFLRTDVLKQVGVFDDGFFMYMEDVDLCRRIGRVSRCVYYPFVSVTHGYAKGSYRNLRLLRFHMKSALRYFAKWGWFIDDERKRLNQHAGMPVGLPGDCAAS